MAWKRIYITITHIIIQMKTRAMMPWPGDRG